MKDGNLGETIGSEDGHWSVAGTAIIAGAGAIALGIGAATDTGWLAIVGGIVAGLGFVAYDGVRHSILDKEFFRRTDKLQ